MGSGASAVARKLPAVLDEVTIRKLAGDSFDEAAWATTEKDANGNITREQWMQFLMFLGNGVQDKYAKGPRPVEAGGSGMATTLRVLVEGEQLDINEADEQGATAAWRAAERGHIDVLRLCIELVPHCAARSRLIRPLPDCLRRKRASLPASVRPVPAGAPRRHIHAHVTAPASSGDLLLPSLSHPLLLTTRRPPAPSHRHTRRAVSWVPPPPAGRSLGPASDRGADAAGDRRSYESPHGCRRAHRRRRGSQHAGRGWQHPGGDRGDGALV